MAGPPSHNTLLPFHFFLPQPNIAAQPNWKPCQLPARKPSAAQIASPLGPRVHTHWESGMQPPLTAGPTPFGADVRRRGSFTGLSPFPPRPPFINWQPPLGSLSIQKNPQSLETVLRATEASRRSLSRSSQGMRVRYPPLGLPICCVLCDSLHVPVRRSLVDAHMLLRV